MRKISLFILLIVLLTSCAPSDSAIQTAIARTKSAYTPTPVPTDPPTATSTPQPTSALAGTITPGPTGTPAPRPLKFSGSGDSTINLSEKWIGPAVLHILGPAIQENFVVTSYDSSGGVDILVNAIGAYEGVVPIEIRRGAAPTASLDVKSYGDWTVEVLPLTPEYIQMLNVPGTLNGVGDQVIGIRGVANSLYAKCSNKADFSVYAYTAAGEEVMLFGEIGPFEGTQTLPANVYLLVIDSRCEWSLELT
jgi:hypothetical protein